MTTNNIEGLIPPNIKNIMKDPKGAIENMRVRERPVQLKYDPSSRQNISKKFEIIRGLFKQLSPEIHDRLKYPNKLFGSVGSKKGTGAVNTYEYAKNIDGTNTLEQLKLLYKIVNVVLDDIDLKEDIIDDVKPYVPLFRKEREVKIGVEKVYNYVTGRFTDLEHGLRVKGVLLNNVPFYFIYALNELLEYLSTLESCTHGRVGTLAKNKTIRGDRCLQINELSRLVSEYKSILTHPSKGMNNTIKALEESGKKMPSISVGITRRVRALGGRRSRTKRRRTSRRNKTRKH